MTRLSVLALLFALTGCATVDGVGQDVQTAGEAVSDASDDVRNDM